MIYQKIKIHLSFILVFSSLLSSCISPKTPKKKEAKKISITKPVKGLKLISPEIFKPHLKYLSSDDLEGRYTGEIGQKKAAKYIAKAFKDAGLKPINTDGSFFQQVKLLNIGPDTTTGLTLNNKRFVTGKDFIPLGPNLSSKKIKSIMNSMFFGGLGIEDSSYKSYDKNDVKGKYVMVLGYLKEAEEKFGDVSSIFNLIANASSKNAKGVVISAPTDAFSAFSRMVVKKRSLALPNQDDDSSSLAVLLISEDIAKEILKTQNKDIENLKTSLLNKAETFSLKDINITTDYANIVDTVYTENVAGLIPGKTDNTIVVTAHYDHLGKDEEGNAFNGADDNGSGTSTLISLARIFSQSNTMPTNNVLFLAVTGEELGLLGSAYYTDLDPIIPLDQIKANINIDMIGRVDDVYKGKKNKNYIYVVGSDKISKDLDDELKKANKESVNLNLDYTYNDESHPMNIYRRSDHYNFAKKGIPVVFFFRGLHSDYHQITDDYEKINFEGLAKVNKLIYTLLWNLSERNLPLKKISN